MKKTLLFKALLLSATNLFAQDYKSTKTKLSNTMHNYLPTVLVVGTYSKSEIVQMPEIVGTSIYAGKKNSLIIVDNVKGNVVSNTMRQVIAKVPGIHIWENDGSGIQIGIATRGLSPNRSWEFNVRQNGYDIAADPYGYPEAYYNPQLQAVNRIEILRGHGALQYGPQFGGMINYILENGSTINKPIRIESQQTFGTAGLFNSFNALGGSTEKFHYYTFFDHRSANGWRSNSAYKTNTGFGSFTWKFNPKFSLTAEIMHNAINSQQAGGLTDQQIKDDAKQSLRSRNWMNIEWTTAALISNYTISDKVKMNSKIFWMQGDRKSVGFLKEITVTDSINTVTGNFNNRTTDIDNYRNLGFENRLLADYFLGKTRSTLSAGIRLYSGNTFRYRNGLGTTGSDADFSLVDNKWPRDIDYHSFNAALFAENIFRLNENFIIIPGVRYEYLAAKASGRNGYDANVNEILLQNEKRNRGFLLAGIGSEYHFAKTELYANITQAYRPIQFADLTAPPTTDIIDPEIKDSKGFNADIGYRGKLKNWLFFDAGIFWLQYNNRIGSITRQRDDGSFYNYRTNAGNSSSKGIEVLAEISAVHLFTELPKNYDFLFYGSYSFTDARYGNFKIITKKDTVLTESNLKNKKVENAPTHILRSGATFSYKTFSFTAQLSYTSSAFADANNTEAVSANAQVGKIPAYTITDISAVYTLKSKFNIKAGINNLGDKRYFTRRASGYPGPGALPSDGRSFYISAGIKL